MCDNMNRLKLILPDLICNDYESVASIKSEVEAEMGRSVLDQEVHEALCSLRLEGKVTAYIFDESIWNYVVSQPSPEDPLQDFWWFAEVE